MNLSTLFADPMQFYTMVFIVIIVVFTIIMFRSGKASAKAMGMVFAISVLLTAALFTLFNPGYGQVVLFYLAVGVIGIGLVFLSKTWSRLAASVLVGLGLLAMYIFSYRPELGIWFVAIVVGAVVLIGLMGVKIYGMSKGYGHRKPDVVTMTMTDPRSGRVLTATAKRGAFTGPTANDQPRDAPLLETFVADAVALFPDTQERAKFLVSQPDVQQLMPFVDGETNKEVLLLQSGKRAARRK